jgi:hypothetical protein
VRGKCTTRLDVYILKEKCLDQREERKAVALFLCRRREKREKKIGDSSFDYLSYENF